MTDYEIRQQVLQHLYDIKDEMMDIPGHPIRLIQDKLSLSEQAVRNNGNQLLDMGLARHERVSLDGPRLLFITTKGINSIEGVSTTGGGNVTHNTINTSTAQGNSNVVIGSGTLNNKQTNLK